MGRIGLGALGATLLATVACTARPDEQAATGAGGGANGRTAPGGAAGALSSDDLCDETFVEDGPSGYDWCLWASEGSTATWVEEPNSDRLRAELDDGEWGSAGVNAILSTEGPVDLSGYDQLVFEAYVPEGLPFEAGVTGVSGQANCSYELVGRGEDRYVVEFDEPDWCNPTQCGFDLQTVNGVSVGSRWEPAEPFELTLTSLAFETTSGGAGTIRGFDAAKGPGGACWFPAAWSDDASASWVSAPTSESAHATATSGMDATASLSLELADRPVDVTQYRYVEFDAIVSADPVFAVKFEGDARVPEGCGFDLVAEEGLTTYAIDPAFPDWCYGSPEFGLKTAVRLDFAADWLTESSLDIEVFDLRFVE